ncbi:MAG: formate--tetrahydrofolate ligase, partial [Deltaproteobacteria bacterium]|nr:formate--tetrahydrofolate ligase [Deltaproteobacteria bacterium]
MKTDLEIAQAHQLKRIEQVADELGIEESELEPYGKTKGKIQLSALNRLKDRPIGKYIVVTAVTPTPLGEGKTLTTIGLTQSLGAIGKRAICTLREPSMGPLFGIKGG